MEWMTSSEGNEVDIGFTSLLRVSSMQPSTVWLPGDKVPLTSERVDLESFDWEQEIPLSVAQGILERTMYHFKQVRPLKGYPSWGGRYKQCIPIPLTTSNEFNKIMDGCKTAMITMQQN